MFACQVWLTAVLYYLTDSGVFEDFGSCYFRTDWTVKRYQAASKKTANQYPVPLLLDLSFSETICQIFQIGISHIGMKLFQS